MGNHQPIEDKTLLRVKIFKKIYNLLYYFDRTASCCAFCLQRRTLAQFPVAMTTLLSPSSSC